MKMTVRFTMLALLTALSCTTPQGGEPGPSNFTPEDEASIRSLLNQWAVNTSEGRFLENLALHTDDAAELLTPPVEGKAAMRERWEHDLTTKEYGQTAVTVREVAGMGDLAYAWSQFRQEGMADGTPFVADGNWLVILRRESPGNWLIHRTIWTAAAVTDDSTEN